MQSEDEKVAIARLQEQLKAIERQISRLEAAQKVSFANLAALLFVIIEHWLMS